MDNVIKFTLGGIKVTKMDCQPIDYILQNNLDYCEANVIKYISRHKTKNKKQDILKAIHYCEIILRTQYAEEASEEEIYNSPRD